ncbi:MAG: DUF456 domain-containing protein [Planctomycetota bacterium]
MSDGTGDPTHHIAPDFHVNFIANPTGLVDLERFSASLTALTILAQSSELPNSNMGGGWMAGMQLGGTLALAVTMVLVCLVCWGLNLIALPGNWIAVAVMALFAWLGPSEGRLAIGIVSVGIAFLLALVGEGVEFMAGAMGASRAGASRRSTLYAMLGSIIGAIVGAFIGVPIPVVGSVLAAILFGGLGATAGAIYGEWSDGKPWRESWAVGHAAFWGRTFGTLGKALIGLGIVLTAFVAICI